MPARRWRIIVVEDYEPIARQIKESGEGGAWATGDETFEVVIREHFDDALQFVESTRCDLAILDIRDEARKGTRDGDTAGMALFEQLRKVRFMPIVFHTALPEHAPSGNRPFVRVVEKTSGLGALAKAVKELLATRLPAFARHLENEYRRYLWDCLDEQWEEIAREPVEFVYLLARRLARTLERAAVLRFLSDEGVAAGGGDGSSNIHPIEFYIWPPLDAHGLYAGDVFREAPNGKHFWIALTPTCDFVQSKVDRVLLARCEELANREELKRCRSEAGSARLSKTAFDPLKKLITDRGKERYKFLPGTFFLPDLVVDFESIRSASPDDLNAMERVASLDSPFAEALLARFSRYYGRLGTPDLEIETVLRRLKVEAPA